MRPNFRPRKLLVLMALLGCGASAPFAVSARTEALVRPTLVRPTLPIKAPGTTAASQDAGAARPAPLAVPSGDLSAHLPEPRLEVVFGFATAPPDSLTAAAPDESIPTPTAAPLATASAPGPAPVPAAATAPPLATPAAAPASAVAPTGAAAPETAGASIAHLLGLQDPAVLTALQRALGFIGDEPASASAAAASQPATGQPLARAAVGVPTAELAEPAVALADNGVRPPLLPPAPEPPQRAPAREAIMLRGPSERTAFEDPYAWAVASDVGSDRPPADELALVEPQAPLVTHAPADGGEVEAPAARAAAPDGESAAPAQPSEGDIRMSRDIGAEGPERPSALQGLTAWAAGRSDDRADGWRGVDAERSAAVARVPGSEREKRTAHALTVEHDERGEAAPAAATPAASLQAELPTGTLPTPAALPTSAALATASAAAAAAGAGAATATAPAAANPGEETLFGPGPIALADDRLDRVRGGFVTPAGLQISFGIERAVYVNGALVSSTALNVTGLGDARGGSVQVEPGSAVSQGLTIIQNGPGNTFTSGAVSPTTLGTVVQNTLNDQKIQSITLINATVNSLQVLKAQNLSSSLRGAVIDSLRR